MGLDNREHPRVAERLREAMPPLDLGGRSVAARVDALPASSRWLRTSWGRWSLRVAAAAAFLALGAWYGLSAAHRVATDLTPGPSALGSLSDPVIRTRIGGPTVVSSETIRRATDAYVAELIRIERERERLTPAQRTAAEAAARATLAKTLQELAHANPR